LNITNILPAKPEIDSLNLNRLSDVMRSIWGDLLDTESMADTPSRVLKHWQTITSGLNQDPKLPLQKTFPCDHDEIVLIKDIAFNSLCEHHLLPFFGVAHVAYIPHGRVVGLSKIPRSLDILAARPQLQERLTTELALAIESALNPVGVAVILSAEHTCMSTRGVLKHGTQTVTSCMLGAFRTDLSARSEILSLVK
jgi:GTP cyclohydrolase IA